MTLSDPSALIGLKEDAVMRMLSRLGVPHQIQMRDGVPKSSPKNNKYKLRLEIQSGIVTRACML